MTREEKQKAIYVLKNSAPVFPLKKPEEYNDYIQTINQVMDWLEQQPRKGHWVLTDVEGYKVWHCHCSECGKDPQDYIGGSEDWWLIKNKLPKFCPNCGSDNSEEEE